METTTTTTSQQEQQENRKKRRRRRRIHRVLEYAVAVVCPPLAVFLVNGHRCCQADLWVCLCLTLCFWIPGVLHAFLVIAFTVDPIEEHGDVETGLSVGALSVSPPSVTLHSTGETRYTSMQPVVQQSWPEPPLRAPDTIYHPDYAAPPIISLQADTLLGVSFASSPVDGFLHGSHVTLSDHLDQPLAIEKSQIPPAPRLPPPPLAISTQLMSGVGGLQGI